MSRDYLDVPQQPALLRHSNGYNKHPQHNYNDYGINPQLTQTRKQQAQPDLVIFNGHLPDRQLYHSNEKVQGQTQGTVKVQKNLSQKKLPIIYQAKGESVLSTTHGERRMGGSRGQEGGRQHEDNIESNSSEVYQYGQMFPQTASENGVDANGFQTFKYIPPENNPQTAHFIPEVSQTQERRFRDTADFRERSDRREIISPREQNMEYLTVHGHEQRQQQQHGYHPFQNMEGSSRSMSKVVTPLGRPPSSQTLPMQPPLSPRNNHENRIQINTQSDGGPNMIKIPQEEYQKFIDHLPLCRQSREEIGQLKAKNSDLAQKQHFYWEENITLREENQRLRDLVTHLQKREKELTRSKDGLRDSYETLIGKYKESALEEFALLFQRYKLEIQRG